MAVPAARDDMEGHLSCSEKKESYIEVQDEFKTRWSEESDTLGSYLMASDEECTFSPLERSSGIRQISSQRNRSLISTLLYLQKGSRSNPDHSDWGFLAAPKGRKRWCACEKWSCFTTCAFRQCSCFATSQNIELHDVHISKLDETYRKQIESNARDKMGLRAWQNIENMMVHVTEMGINQKELELELYLHKHQITFYNGEKVKPRYIVNLSDIQSVSYLKDSSTNTEIERESSHSYNIKGIVLEVRERGRLKIICKIKHEVEKLAISLRANELIMNCVIEENAPRDHPISEEESKLSALKFGEKVRSGDIILFTTDNLSGKIIRKFTSGEYDHIAIAFKFPSGKCGILESLQNTGVAAFLWDGLLKTKAYQEYKRIVIRPLILPLERKNRILKKIDRFVFDASQSKLNYGLGAKKWIRKKSFAVEPWDESRTYFCSELVAKCLKQVKLLRTNPASCQYVPSDFAEASSIQLLKGCYYGQEVEIGFEELNLEDSIAVN